LGRYRGWIALLAGVLLALSPAGSGQALAHGGAHLYESVVAGITPPQLAAGIEVRMIDYDRQMELVNHSGKTVIVEGYWGEPYARLESSGAVYLNAMSPSMAPSNDRMGLTRPNGNEDASAPPHWVQVGDNGEYRWFDRRTQYRKEGMPPAVNNEEQRTRLWSYLIPIRVGDQAAAIKGALYWTGRKPFPTGILIFLLLSTAGCALLGAWTVRRLRRRDEAGDGPDDTDGIESAG